MVKPIRSKSTQHPLPASDAPVLRTDLLARIHALNADYLELLAAEKMPGGRVSQSQYFPPKLWTHLAELPFDSRLEISKVPYTLYSLSFQDVRFWQAACETCADAFDSRYVSNPDAGLQATFCEVALIHAWHAVLSEPLAARILYAIEDDVATLLTATPLWQIKRIAGDYPGLLLPRWPTNPGFWPDLLAFAGSNDPKRLATTQLLGTQLMAGELGTSAECAATSPARLRRSRRGTSLGSPITAQSRVR